MDKESILAKNISCAEEKAALDASCKRLLANKSILAWILKDCIEEYSKCDVHEIADKYIENEPQIAEISVNPDESNRSIRGLTNEDTTITEGTITYDIRFVATVPSSDELIQLIINIEAQNDFYPGYPLVKRGIYYCSRMISSQYGVEFTQSHYGDIKKVYSIWICMNPPKNRENTITRYKITEENILGNVSEPIPNYDLLTAVMVCLGDSNDNNVIKLLNTLLSSEKQPEEKKNVLQKDFEIQMTQKFDDEVNDMCNISKGVEERGIAKGIEKATLDSIINLMNSLNISEEKAMDALKIPVEERSKYLNLLNKTA